MVRGESGKGGMPVRGRGWQLWAHVYVHTQMPYRQARTIRLTLTAASITT